MNYADALIRDVFKSMTDDPSTHIFMEFYGIRYMLVSCGSEASPKFCDISDGVLERIGQTRSIMYTVTFKSADGSSDFSITSNSDNVIFKNLYEAYCLTRF